MRAGDHGGDHSQQLISTNNKHPGASVRKSLKCRLKRLDSVSLHMQDVSTPCGALPLIAMPKKDVVRVDVSRLQGQRS